MGNDISARRSVQFGIAEDGEVMVLMVVAVFFPVLLLGFGVHVGFLQHKQHMRERPMRRRQFARLGLAETARQLAPHLLAGCKPSTAN